MLTGALTVATVCVRILCSRLHVSITISTNVDILCARGQTMIEFGVNSAAWGILTGGTYILVNVIAAVWAKRRENND